MLVHRSGWGARSGQRPVARPATKCSAACLGAAASGAGALKRDAPTSRASNADGIPKIRPLLVPSVYEITATVETSEADSDLSDNTSTLRVEVVDAISGGGSDSPAVTVSKVRLAPVNPKAGSLVFASVQIFAGAVPVKPTRLICAATVGGVKLVGTPRARRKGDLFVSPEETDEGEDAPRHDCRFANDEVRRVFVVLTVE